MLAQHFPDVVPFEGFDRLPPGLAETRHNLRRGLRWCGKRDVVGQDLCTGAKYQRALDDVIQFADVARPAVDLQHVQGSRRKGLPARAGCRAARFQEVARQQIDVPAPVAQRWQAKLEYVEAEVEVGAELFFPDARFQIAIGSGNQSNVGPSESVCSQRAIGSVLKEAQKLGLSGQREGINLIQE